MSYWTKEFVENLSTRVVPVALSSMRFLGMISAAVAATTSSAVQTAFLTGSSDIATDLRFAKVEIAGLNFNHLCPLETHVLNSHLQQAVKTSSLDRLNGDIIIRYPTVEENKGVLDQLVLFSQLSNGKAVSFICNMLLRLLKGGRTCKSPTQLWVLGLYLLPSDSNHMVEFSTDNEHCPKADILGNPYFLFLLDFHNSLLFKN